LYCTSDSIHTGAATNFSYGDLLATVAPTPPALAAKQGGLGKISYFVNGDATESDPQAIMTGDCNIGNSPNTAATAPAGFRFGGNATSETVGPVTAVQLTGVAWGAAANAWAWTQGDLHQKAGNAGIADGSVQQLSISGLHTALSNCTNTVAQPYFNFPW